MICALTVRVNQTVHGILRRTIGRNTSCIGRKATSGAISADTAVVKRATPTLAQIIRAELVDAINRHALSATLRHSCGSDNKKESKIRNSHLQQKIEPDKSKKKHLTLKCLHACQKKCFAMEKIKVQSTHEERQKRGKKNQVPTQTFRNRANNKLAPLTSIKQVFYRPKRSKKRRNRNLFLFFSLNKKKKKKYNENTKTQTI